MTFRTSSTVSLVAPSRERGLKSLKAVAKAPYWGRSFAGAWIEIVYNKIKWAIGKVAPSRERGLKCASGAYNALVLCRSFAGAWIEISFRISVTPAASVAPSRERGLKSTVYTADHTPKAVAPSRERGLKFVFAYSFNKG